LDASVHCCGGMSGMVNEWIKPYQAWLKLHEATDGYIVNYG